MGEYDVEKASCPEVEEGGVETKDGGVRELEEGSENDAYHRNARMRNLEFIGVMDVREAKVERHVEDEVLEIGRCGG